jgi:hypothetical protein
MPSNNKKLDWPGVSSLKGGQRMSILLVETYVVRAEKRAEFMPLLNEFLKCKENHPQLFDGLKSWKLYKQDIGQPAGLYIEVWEYESLAQMEEIDRRIFADEEMKKISAEFHQLIEPVTFSTGIWSPVA